ncbi:hypothetical protein HK097_003648 [Rhizophlyctis rosea]|uniref:F-box domain-containing protein n=1 Tax=Rhizophlyctis rosea TaxID=64517 RepID=A0AAD5SFC9_9FUNG|nr:hypothetical protein HK097_003648 [Rhizophlyctis rosea]
MSHFSPPRPPLRELQSLPSELLAEILSHLPRKTLFKTREVSKTFHLAAMQLTTTRWIRGDEFENSIGRALSAHRSDRELDTRTTFRPSTGSIEKVISPVRLDWKWLRKPKAIICFSHLRRLDSSERVEPFDFSYIPFHPTAYDCKTEVLTLRTDVSHNVKINIRTEKLSSLYISWTGWGAETLPGLLSYIADEEDRIFAKPLRNIQQEVLHSFSNMIKFDGDHIAPAYFDSSIGGMNTIRSPLDDYAVKFCLSDEGCERFEKVGREREGGEQGEKESVDVPCRSLRIEEVKMRVGFIFGGMKDWKEVRKKKLSAFSGGFCGTTFSGYPLGRYHGDEPTPPSPPPSVTAFPTLGKVSKSPEALHATPRTPRLRIHNTRFETLSNKLAQKSIDPSEIFKHDFIRDYLVNIQRKDAVAEGEETKTRDVEKECMLLVRRVVGVERGFEDFKKERDGVGNGRGAGIDAL